MTSTALLPLRAHTHPHWFRAEILGRGPGTSTFAMLKPDAVRENRVEAIIDMIVDHGLCILTAEERVLGVQDIRALYWAHVGKFYYERNEQFINSGPCLLLALGGEGAVDRWRQGLMPDIRRQWSPYLDNSEMKHVNLVHGSDSAENAFRELHYFFH